MQRKKNNTDNTGQNKRTKITRNQYNKWHKNKPRTQYTNVNNAARKKYQAQYLVQRTTTREQDREKERPPSPQKTTNDHTCVTLQESSWYRSCLHKGLVANIIFFLIMILGVILGEVRFPLEGLRGRNVALSNDTMCINEQFEGNNFSWMWCWWILVISHIIACVTVRVVRAIGVFGFLGKSVVSIYNHCNKH